MGVIPNISMDEQERIVEEIQAEISKQEDTKNKIIALRNQIDDIIMEIIEKQKDHP